VLYRDELVHEPSPVTELAALEASSRVAGVLRRLSSSVRDLDTDFVTHKEALVVLGNALMSSLLGVEFLHRGEKKPTRRKKAETYDEAISNPMIAPMSQLRKVKRIREHALQFDVGDGPYFTEAALEIFSTSGLGQTTNVHLVELDRARTLSTGDTQSDQEKTGGESRRELDAGGQVRSIRANAVRVWGETPNDTEDGGSMDEARAASTFGSVLSPR
jgi:hypothetical protein